MKRTFDVIVGSALAALATPVIIVLALLSAVRFRAWPFFTQPRAGLGNRPFRVVKIRSLAASTPARIDKYQLQAVRISRFGQFIRGHHLDELPQLWLVPFGQMSLVGPRPEMIHLLHRFDDEHLEARSRHRPGCTGLWQISPACAEMMYESPAYDMFYDRHRSLRLDLWILRRTIGEVLGEPPAPLIDVPHWASSARDAHRDSNAFQTCGVRINAIALHDAVDTVLAAKGGLTVHLCNAYTLALASKSDRLIRTLNQSGLNLADGMPLVWIAQQLGYAHIDRRVYGPDLMAAVIDRGQESQTRHFLFGSTPEVLDALGTEISSRWPAAKIVGAIAPPFHDISDDELRESLHTIDTSEADIVWVGMGTPKQDELVERLGALSSRTFVAIGAAFDFIAGTTSQAPSWMRRNGLEWLYRFASEPRRLWRRYVFGNARFVWVNLRSRPTRLADVVT